MEKPKDKKSFKTYGKSSQDIFEFHGASDGEYDFSKREDLDHKARKRKKNEFSEVDKAVNKQASQGGDAGRRPITSSGRDTELLSTEPKRHEISSAGERDLSWHNSMPPPASKISSLEQSQPLEACTLSTTAEPTPPESPTSNRFSSVRATYVETHTGDRMPSPARSSHSEVDEQSSRGLIQSGNNHSMRSNEGVKDTHLQLAEDPAASPSPSQISPCKTVTVERTNERKKVSQELSLLDRKHLRSQLGSNMLTMANPVVLLPAPMGLEGDQDELSLFIPDTTSKSPTKPSKPSKRKRNVYDEPVDEFGSDDNAIGIPKEHYQPRPSKRRSGGGDQEMFVPTDFSKKPEAMCKGKRKTKRHKTTAFQELLPKDEDEDEEVMVVPDPRFDIPEMKLSKASTEIDLAEMESNDNAEETRPEAQSEPKQAVKPSGQKKRGKTKKAVTTFSEEEIVGEVEVDQNQEDVETKDPVISATAKSRKKTKTKETPTPIMAKQDHNNNGVSAAEDDRPASILSETPSNNIPSKPAAKPLPETSPSEANPPPETPRKSTTPAPKGPDKHSPISSGKVAYRVGLSKRARIAPLLRIVRK